MVDSSNLVSALFSGAVSIITTFGVVTLTNRHKYRQTDHQRELSASEREVEARAEFVELLQKRVNELEARIDMAARRESEMFERNRREQFDLERRYRHLAASLVTYASVLTLKLRDLGVTDIPPFGGWNRFMEEGGNPPPNWRSALPDEG